MQREAERIAPLVGNQGLQALVNNAGIVVAGPLLHLPLEELRTQFEVNVIGLIATTKAFAPLLGAKDNCPHPPGKIYNMSSVAGKLAQPFLGPYCASKHAVESLSESLRMELFPYGIDVVVLGPGVVRTPIWDKAQDINLDRYAHTGYKKALHKLQNFVDHHSKTGYDQAEFGRLVADIIGKAQPRWRYALVKEHLSKWVLPSLMSKKQFAAVIGKRLGLR